MAGASACGSLCFVNGIIPLFDRENSRILPATQAQREAASSVPSSPGAAAPGPGAMPLVGRDTLFHREMPEETGRHSWACRRLRGELKDRDGTGQLPWTPHPRPSPSRGEGGPWDGTRCLIGKTAGFCLPSRLSARRHPASHRIQEQPHRVQGQCPWVVGRDTLAGAMPLHRGAVGVGDGGALHAAAAGICNEPTRATGHVV
jgi:hypothetical protein